jgi:hypothetical protein
LDDKIITAIDASLAQMVTSLEEIRRALVVAGGVTPEASVQNLQKSYANRELREAASKDYMSGRWVRRDGDIYGAPAATPYKPAAVTPLVGDASANRKTGDL